MKAKTPRVLFYLVVCGSLGFGLLQMIQVGSMSSIGQDTLRTVEQAFSSNPQVRVTDLKVGRETRQFNEGFNEGPDWPKRLSLKFENVAPKPIVYLQVNLNFPETRSSGNLMSYPVVFGIRPNSKIRSANKPLLLMPGEKLEVVIDPHYEKLAHFIETRHAMKHIRKVEVEIGFIVFEDKTAWSAGDFLRPDPNNPDFYINIGRTVPD